MQNTQISKEILIFQGRKIPEPSLLVGYGALIEKYKLSMPMPRNLALISSKNRKYFLEGWLVFSQKYQPDENLSGHLVFAIKYEGINLLFFKKYFRKFHEMKF